MSTTGVTRSHIEALIERVLEAADDPENERRRRRRPSLTVGIEDPVAWTKILSCDANELYCDPYFSFAGQLEQKLWRWEHVCDDTPIDTDVRLFLSHYPEYTFLGICLQFTSEGIPNFSSDHPLRQTPDCRLLEPVDFRASGWMPRILQWYEVFLELADGRLDIVFPDWGRGCLDLAVELRGYEQLMVDVAERPGFVHELLGFLTLQRCRWYEEREQYLQLSRPRAAISDDWLNVPFISPEFFEEFVLPRYLEIEHFHGGIASVHSCGNQTPLQSSLLRLESLGVFEVSPWTDLEVTVRQLPQEKEIAVSVHPNDVLVASDSQMRSKLEGIVDACSGRAYRLGTSGLTPLSSDIDRFTTDIARWTDAARDIMGRGSSGAAQRSSESHRS